MAGVVPVSHEADSDRGVQSQSFGDGKKIRQGLTGVQQIGESVDHRDSGMFRQLHHRAVLVGAGDDPMDPAFQVARHVLDGFPLPELGVAVIQKQGLSSHAGHPHVEGHPRPQGGLLEDHGQGLSLQAEGEFVGSLFDSAGDRKNEVDVFGSQVLDGQEIGDAETPPGG